MTAANPLELLVRRLESHTVLTEEDRAALLALPYTVRRLESTTALVWEGNAPTQCALLVSGYAYRQKLTENGARQILSFHIPGEPLDLQHLFLDEADHSVMTLTAAEVAIIPRAPLRDLTLTHPSIGRAILVYLLVEASIYREWILNVGRRSAQARIAHLLCELAIRLDGQGLAGKDGYRLQITQEQLADAVGLTPVHVNRSLKVLAAKGLIERDRRQISFPQWDELRRVAGFNTRYLHLAKQA